MLISFEETTATNMYVFYGMPVTNMNAVKFEFASMQMSVSLVLLSINLTKYSFRLCFLCLFSNGVVQNTV